MWDNTSSMDLIRFSEMGCSVAAAAVSNSSVMATTNKEEAPLMLDSRI
jgi:hypothetical protein